MKTNNPGTFWIILGYILVPFIALYKIITEPARQMSDWQKFFYICLVMIVIAQIGEYIEYLLK